MSIVEQPVDSIKAGSSFCDIPANDVMSDSRPIEMDLDMDKTQSQNGSASAAIDKEIVDIDKLKSFQLQTAQPMDVDTPTNGNNGVEVDETKEKNGDNETEVVTSGEAKTDDDESTTQLENKQEKEVANKKKDDEKEAVIESKMETSEVDAKENNEQDSNSIKNGSNKLESVELKKTPVVIKEEAPVIKETPVIKEAPEEAPPISQVENETNDKQKSENDVGIEKDADAEMKTIPNNTIETTENVKSEDETKVPEVSKEPQPTEIITAVESKNETKKVEEDQPKAVDKITEPIVEGVNKTPEKESTTNEKQPEGGDQEMPENLAVDQDMPEEKSAADETENQSTVTVPEMSQTVFVDENRYFESGKMIELSRIGWTSSADKQQYVRGCLWSPDGTCILTAVNMDGMHVINLPTDLYTNDNICEDRPLDKLESVINVKEGGTVYDYCWYPFMNSTMPETCCWLSSRQHCPIQLWDGFTGELRGSYRGYDNVDEIEAAFSVIFTSDAEKVIGGYKKTLKIFDTKSPGREYSVIPTKQPCSCLAVQETQSNIIATGTWNCMINLFDLRAPKLGSLVTLTEHSGGVTFLKFAASGDSLFSGARKDNQLFEWDMRNFSKPIRRLSRTVTTNQRIYFDLSPGEKWLVSGDTEGLVRIWDLKTEKTEEDFTFGLHQDCCNGVSFHPSRPMLATCSGQYHFGEDIGEKKEEIYENSLIFWWCGDVKADKEDENKETADEGEKKEIEIADDKALKE